MQKKLLIALIVAAAGIWLWNARLLFVELWPSPVEEVLPAGRKAAKTEQAGRAPRTVSFVEKGKSPFLPYSEKPRVQAPVTKPRVTKNPAPSKPQPKVVVTGIMWNDANPLVMLQLPDGSSTVAKKGQELAGGIVVKKIEKARVLVSCEGTEWWVKK